jgi:PST family polysaccharide transporter
MALNFIIASLSVIHQSLLEKEMKFEMIAKFETLAAILGSVGGIGCAFFGFGVWSLVIQVMVTTTMFSLFIWFSNIWKPSLVINWAELKSVVKFSANLSGFNLLNYLVRNTDYLLIQKYLGERLLGYYNLAYRIMLYPLENISAIVSRVMFPYYSRMQDNNTDFRNSYLKIINSIALITFPMMLWLMTSSKIFVLVLLGDKWSHVIILLIILAPVGLVQSIYTPAGVIFQSKGRTDWWFRWGLITAVLTLSAFVIGLNWGTIGVAIAYLIVTVITFYPGLAIPFKLIDLKVLIFLKSLSTTFFISLFVSVIIFFINYLLVVYLSNVLTLLTSVITYLTLYLLISFKYNKKKVDELIAFIKFTDRNILSKGLL